MVSEKKKVTQINQSYAQEQERKQEWQKTASGKYRRGLVRRLTALGIVGAALAVVFTIILTSQWSTLEAKKTERSQLETKMEELETEEANLEQDIENYNDLDYIAEVARRDYYLTKPGETLYKTPDDSTVEAD
ncbi:septum formation initiator family protein [Salibacterium salarium]|uniref:Septum formation initiator family protein n=1 Tax=Salibacterium salarium TaxID=284579 RepID=A0A3R9P086_9BACI|nr:septum formation initiator family protein [Salibacterium salarium]RSL30046.1 septum formation initiator family protein [Salibacterium salarium]